MKIGLISDTHIPNRAKRIPQEFLDWFIDENVDMIIHCGDVTSKESLKPLQKITEDIKVVRGNSDYYDYPKELLLSVDDWKIYVFHSSDVYPRGDVYQLYKRGIEKKVDIVIFGHTHIPFFTKVENIFLINPGSATGVWSGEVENTPKSVAILELKKKSIKARYYII